LNDPDQEPNETFTVGLSSPSGGTIGASLATVTVADNDYPVIRFTLPTSTVTEGPGATASIAVRAETPEGGAAGPVSTQYSTSNITAVAGSDYTSASGTLSFPSIPAGGVSQDITVAITNDVYVEPTKTFRVSLTSPSGATLGQATNIVSIADDEALGPALSIADLSATEGVNQTTQTFSFPVTLSALAPADVTVNYATSDGNTTAGTDYIATSGTLTIPTGSLSANIDVTVKGDGSNEPDEAFLVTLTNPVGAGLLRDEAQGVIVDDDGNLKPSLCSPIATVPITLGVAGNYCLVKDMSRFISTGSAIAIAADDIHINLRGFRLDGSLAASGSQADGIAASGRRGIVVENGTISGFYRGIFLDDASPFTSFRGHRIDRIQAKGNTYAGLWVAGRGSLVRRSQVLDTGGTTVNGLDTDAFGIASFGAENRVLDNDVFNVFAAGSGSASAIEASSASSSVFKKNRIGRATFGLRLISSTAALVQQNRFSSLGWGVLFEPGSSGRFRDNLSAGVGTPYSGGTDAGNNQ